MDLLNLERFLKDPCQVRGREWAKLTAGRREQLLAAAFDYWRERGFPYYQLSNDQIAAEFESLKKTPCSSAFRRGGVLGSVVGLRLANHFQPHMWRVRVSRYRSPMDVFDDDRLLKSALARAWRIWPDRFGANPSCLRRILKTFPGTASVSNFRPTLSRAIIARYSSRRAAVVDFSAGYGGRLVGSLTLERAYLGIEPCAEQFEGLERTLEALADLKVRNASARLVKACAEDFLPHLEDGSVELVFSSPPYYDWEKYSSHPSQSFVRYRDYNSWLEKFLATVVRECRRILRPRGRLVLNVSGNRRRPTPEEATRIAEQCGLRLAEEVPMLLARVPYQHPRGAGPYKSELLLVFERP